MRISRSCAAHSAIAFARTIYASRTDASQRLVRTTTKEYQTAPQGLIGVRAVTPRMCVVSGWWCRARCAPRLWIVTVLPGRPEPSRRAPAERSGPGAVCVWRETIALIHTRHRDQGGVGHNNIFINKRNTEHSERQPGMAAMARPRRARGEARGQRSKHGDEPRTRAASLQHHALHACTRTTDALPSCTHAPDPLPNHGLAVGVHLHLRCPSTGLKPNVSSATCPSVCRICLPVLMPYATTDPSAIRLRRLLGA